MYINTKKLFRYFVLLIIGFSILFYGLINLVIEDHSMKTLSDEEIIERAKDLGMMGIEDKILKEMDSDKDK